MALTAAEIMVETLLDWGVDRIFGIPGDGINGIMEALRKYQGKIAFIHTRHEESAAFMACAHAKYTGKLGVCLATSGPGGIHLLNGLYDAKLDGQPVLAITGMQFHDLLATHTQQDVELDKLYMDVAEYNVRIMGPAHVENVIDQACRVALSYKKVAHVTIPVDFQDMKVEKKHVSKRNVPHHTSSVYASSSHLPNLDQLHAAADLLNTGRKVALLVGQGALDAGPELEQIAEKLGAPIVKALLGKAAVADDSPYTTGGIGLLGTRASQEAFETCDTLLIVGSSFPYIEYYPKPGQAKCVQIDRDPARIGLRYPVDVGLIGDSRSTLKELLPLLKSNPDKSFLTSAQEKMKSWWKIMEEQGTRQDKPMKPQVVAWELGKRLREDAIISCDSGTGTTWFARQMKARPGQMYSCSGNLATMACGLPYTIAAQLAYPERQCIAFQGDGAFAMLMGEFATAVQYKLPIKVFVLRNNVLGQIMWEQMVFLGNPEFGCGLSTINFAEVARACGGEGYRLDDPAQCGRVLDEALGNGKPTVIECVVDPTEPPMPGKIKPEQALHFAESLARGTPYGGKIALTALSDKVREMV